MVLIDSNAIAGYIYCKWTRTRFQHAVRILTHFDKKHKRRSSSCNGPTTMARLSPTMNRFFFFLQKQVVFFFFKVAPRREKQHMPISTHRPPPPPWRLECYPPPPCSRSVDLQSPRISLSSSARIWRFQNETKQAGRNAAKSPPIWLY